MGTLLWTTMFLRFSTLIDSQHRPAVASLTKATKGKLLMNRLVPKKMLSRIRSYHVVKILQS